MRLISRIKQFVLVGVAGLMLGFTGCGPGDVVWRVGGQEWVIGGNGASVIPQREEAPK